MLERLSRADLAGIVAFVGEIHAARSVDDFAARLVTGVRAMIPSDFASYNEVDLDRRRVMFVTDPEEFVFDDTHERFAAHLHEHPLVQHYGRTGAGGALRLSDFISRPAFGGTGLYSEVFRRTGTDRILSLGFESRPGAPVVALALHRGGRDFTARDIALLECLRPHLSAAYQSAEERALQAHLRALLPDGQEVVMLGHEGVVRCMSEGAAALIARHLGAGHGPPSDAAQPPPLLEAMAADSAPAQTVVAVGAGPALSVTVLARDATRTTLLLQEHRRPAALALSARERQVLDLVAGGMTNRQVASALGISPWTVKSHLEHAYEKLGVHSRAAAVAQGARR